ncbi:hypothetical protein D6C99_03335 [Aureobasidium pullulans]|nr:hypothetical protein D6C99_03335 [Aureobasidium pullulans]
MGLEITTYLSRPWLQWRHDPTINRKRRFFVPIVDSNALAPHESCQRFLNLDEMIESSNLTKVDSRYMKLTDQAVRSRIENGYDAVIKEEATITRYDEIVGDGDCGYTLRDGAKQVLKFIATGDLLELPQILSELVHDLEVNTGRMSGSLYCIFLTFLSSSLAMTYSVAGALAVALEQVLNYSRARLGDRTMSDRHHQVDRLLQRIKKSNQDAGMTKLGSPLAEGITSSQNTALAPSVWLPPPSTSSNTYDLVNDVASGVDTIQHDPLDFPDYRTPPPCRPSLHSPPRVPNLVTRML